MLKMLPCQVIVWSATFISPNVQQPVSRATPQLATSSTFVMQLVNGLVLIRLAPWSAALLVMVQLCLLQATDTHHAQAPRTSKLVLSGATLAMKYQGIRSGPVKLLVGGLVHLPLVTLNNVPLLRPLAVKSSHVEQMEQQLVLMGPPVLFHVLTAWSRLDRRFVRVKIIKHGVEQVRHATILIVGVWRQFSMVLPRVLMAPCGENPVCTRVMTATL